METLPEITPPQTEAAMKANPQRGIRNPVRRRIAALSDYPALHEGIAMSLHGASDLALCCKHRDEATLLRCIGRERPQLVIIHADGLSCDRMETIRKLRVLHPDLLQLVVANGRTGEYARRYLRAGSNGYALSTCSAERLVAAIREVLATGYHLCREVASPLTHAKRTRPVTREGSAVASLSDRELHVFEMIGQGRSVAEIAARLAITERTVHAHQHAVQRKLRLGTRSQVADRAARWLRDARGHGAPTVPASMASFDRK
jgi:DNA-binding NarL/FixJ family response regulator